MKRNKIFIESLAFEELLRCVNETLKVESGGCLFGRYFDRSWTSKWVVEAVHPIQLAIRTPQQLGYEDKHLENATLSLSNETIGQYHSHVQFKGNLNGKRKKFFPKASLSLFDKSYIKEIIHKRLATLNQGSEDDTEIGFDDLHPHLEILIKVNKRKRTSRLPNNNPLLVSGYLENSTGIYRLDFAGHYYDPREKRFRRAEIKVPSKILRQIS